MIGFVAFLLLGVSTEWSQARNPHSPKNVKALRLTANRTVLVAVLKQLPQFSGLSDVEMGRRIGLFMSQINRSIAIIRKEKAWCGPQIADCLNKLLKADAVCVAVGMKKAASTGWDKCTKCNASEGINLNISLLLESPTMRNGTAAPLHDLITYQLVTNLMHEGGHVKDDGKASAGSANAAAEVQAKVGAAEERAHQRQLITLTEAKQLLDAIVKGMPLPKLNRPLNQELLKDLNLLSQTERVARATTMLAFICNRSIPSLEGEVIRWQIHKNRWNQLLQNSINNQKLRKKQKQSRSFIRPDNSLYGEGKHAYIGGGGLFDFGDGPEQEGTTGIWQDGAEAAEMLNVTGVDHVYDCWVSEDGAMLLVLGGLLDTEDGVMLGYVDTDADGLFEADTRVESIRSNELFGGSCFSWDEAAGQVVVYSRESNGIWGLGYTGVAGHEFPDLLENRGTIGFDRDDILYVTIAEDGLTTWGFGEEWELPNDADTMTPVATTATVGGEFTSGTSFPAFASAEMHPVFLKLPVSGDTAVRASGTAGSEVVVTVLDGGGSVLLGQGSFDALGEGEFTLLRPLVAGESIRVDDLGIATQSMVEVVQSPQVLEAGNGFLVDDVFYVRFQGNPLEPVQVSWGADLTPTEFGETQVDGYGSTWFEVPLEPGQASVFVRGAWIVP
jgi:hypothetical protein